MGYRHYKLFSVFMVVLCFGCRHDTNQLASEVAAKQYNYLLNIENSRSWFPKNVNGMLLEKVSEKASDKNLVNGVTAIYQGAQNQNIQLTLSRNTKNKAVLSSKEINTETDFIIKKTVFRNKLIGIETFYKNSQNAEVTLVYDDQLEIEIISEKTNRHVLWQFIDALSFNDLIK